MSIPFKLEKAVLKEAPSSGGGLLGDSAGAAMGMAAGVAGVGGMLGSAWAGRELNFKFTPEKLMVSKSANFREQPRPTSQQADQKAPSPPQYVGSTNRTLTFS